MDEKIFKIKLPKRIFILSIIVIALCIFGIALTVARLIEFGINGFTDFLKYPFLILLQLFCIILVITVLTNSKYILTQKTLTVQFGITKNQFDIENITSLLLDTDSKKLTLYLGEEYFVLFLPEENNHDFVQAIREKNLTIEYSFTLSEQK